MLKGGQFPFFRLICWIILVSFSTANVTWAHPEEITYLSPPSTTHTNPTASVVQQSIELPSVMDTAPSEETYQKIENWIGSPRGKGPARHEMPVIGEIKKVHVFTRDGQLAAKQIKTLAELGSGFAGTVYEKVEVDESGKEMGESFVEKYYFEVKPKGFSRAVTLIKTISLKLVGLFFKFFRGSPLSYRINLWAVLSNHYANLLVTEASEVHFGRRITPRLLYSRYDDPSGTYVQAYEKVRGRAISYNLEEIFLAIRNMNKWFQFLEKELGLVGIARQTNIRTLTSLNNTWMDEQDNFIALDLVSGVVGVPWEIEYWWKGIVTGNFPIFADAVNYKTLGEYVQEHSQLEETYEKFRFYTVHWSNSEPIPLKSPLQSLRLFRDTHLRKSVGENLLLQLEYKGVLSSEKTSEYRLLLQEKWRFPGQFTHTLLNILPSFWHRVIVDEEFRLQLARRTIGSWIDQFQERRFRTDEEADALRQDLGSNNALIELLWLFSLQNVLRIPKPPGTGIVATVILILTGHYWLLPIVLIDGMIRAFLTWELSGLKYPRALILGMLPVFGGFAVPIEMRAKHYELSLLIVEAMTSETVALIPGLGERGSLLELGAMILVRNFWDKFCSLALAAIAVTIFHPFWPVAVVMFIGFIVGSFSDTKISLTNAVASEILSQLRGLISQAQQNPQVWDQLQQVIGSQGGTVNKESGIITIGLPIAPAKDETPRGGLLTAL